MNAYQRSKGKKIAEAILKAVACSATVRTSDLPKLVSMMSESDWRTVAFAAGVPLADLPAKREVLAALRNKTLHRVK